MGHGEMRDIAGINDAMFVQCEMETNRLHRQAVAVEALKACLAPL